jgi:meiotic recombination protein REC8
MRTALDREGQNFLSYMESVARAKGHTSDQASDSKHWVEFESLFEVEDQKRAVVAQAFYHVLSLATKNVIKVKQDGQGGNQPFGVIRLVVGVPAEGEQGAVDVDEDEDEEMPDA